MFTMVLNLIALFGIGYSVIWAPFLMAHGVAVMAGEKTLITIVPGANVAYAEKQMDRPPIACILNVLLLTSIILFFTAGGKSGYALVFLIVTAILAVASYIANATLVYKIFKLADYTSTLKSVIYSIIFPCGQVYIGKMLCKYVVVARAEEDKVKTPKKGVKRL